MVRSGSSSPEGSNFISHSYGIAADSISLLVKIIIRMAPAIAIVAAFLCLVAYGTGQPPANKNAEILLLRLGTGQSAITLTKGPFEGDTVYTLTFRNATHSRGGERSTQGFFLFELKAFAKAMQTALKMDTGSEVRFSEGTIERETGGSVGNRIIVTFRTGAGTCRLTQTEAKRLITAVEGECRFGSFQ